MDADRPVVRHAARHRLHRDAVDVRRLPVGAGAYRSRPARCSSFGFWLRRGVDETPQFEQLAESHATAEVPVADVLKYHWKRLLIAGGSRIGSDVLYALIVVFTLTS